MHGFSLVVATDGGAEQLDDAVTQLEREERGVLRLIDVDVEGACREPLALLHVEAHANFGRGVAQDAGGPLGCAPVVGHHRDVVEVGHDGDARKRCDLVDGGLQGQRKEDRAVDSALASPTLGAERLRGATDQQVGCLAVGDVEDPLQLLDVLGGIPHRLAQRHVESVREVERDDDAGFRSAAAVGVDAITQEAAHRVDDVLCAALA